MSRTVFDWMKEITAELAQLRGDHAALEARMERTLRKGKVTDVDAKKQLYRQEIGLDDDGNPVKSPWVSYAQIAGALKQHSPPSKGQQYLLVSPDGDHEQAHGIPLTFSDDNKSPSDDPNSDVETRGKCKDTRTTKDGKDMRMFEVGKSSFKLVDGTLTLTADKIALVGKVYLGSADASRELALKDSVDSAGDKETSNLATKVFGV